MNAKYKINVYKPIFVGNEKKYVNDCLDDVWISGTGKFVDLFENEFAKYVGVKNAITVANGTVALHVALLALGLGEGDEIIVPTFTYIASVNAIKYCNADVVFVDSLAKNWQIDPQDVLRKITKKTKAIMVPHLYGSCAEMDQICKIAKDHNLCVIEDAAEAFGTLYKNQHVGTFGDVATFSFFGNKTITCGEGGMVVTNNNELSDKIRRLKSQGLSKTREYFHDLVGYNYRMTNIAAAIGLAQLEKADQIIAKKRQIANFYRSEFSRSKELQFYPELQDVFNSYWMCSLLFESEELKNRIRKCLDDNGVETRPLFCPAHLMPIYGNLGGVFDVASDISSRGINLPSGAGLTEEELKYITKIILENL